ncbi:MAG: rhomboid family intramembrane serine protease [Verrucomicrobiales bacterium]|nr:rhomboid family intramembrane serine protease [Verrucomicrobiales bacterium]
MQTPPLDALIPAPNRRQAMDWSLVLASQGIEHVIQQDDAAGWALAVAVGDHERALAQIQLYRQENRHWRWRRPLFQPGLFFDWSSLAWVLLTVFFYGWSEARADLRTPGQMDGTALAHGEWWRLFTATWLHADLAHLAANVVFGFLFLGLVMGRYGPGVGLLAAYLAGVGGNIAAWLVHEPTLRGLGASGVVMGALGLFTTQSFALLKRPNAIAFRLFAGAILAGLMLFVFLGTSPGTDVVAHLGGFITGLLLGSLLALAPRLVHQPWVNLAAAILFVALVILPWWLALTSGL